MNVLFDVDFSKQNEISNIFALRGKMYVEYFLKIISDFNKNIYSISNGVLLKKKHPFRRSLDF